MGDETLFTYETSGSRQEVAASLRAVVAQLSGTGPLTLSAGDEAVTVHPSDRLELEVAVEREDADGGDAEVELEIELEWTEVETVERPETRQSTDSPRTTDSADAPGQVDDEAEERAEERAEDRPTVDLEAVHAPESGTVEVAESVGSLATFEVFRDTAGEWRWRLVHRNGNVVATSGEGYTRRRDAENGFGSVVKNAPGAEVVDDLQ